MEKQMNNANEKLLQKLHMLAPKCSKWHRKSTPHWNTKKTTPKKSAPYTITWQTKNLEIPSASWTSFSVSFKFMSSANAKSWVCTLIMANLKEIKGNILLLAFANGHRTHFERILNGFWTHRNGYRFEWVRLRKIVVSFEDGFERAWTHLTLNAPQVGQRFRSHFLRAPLNILVNF